MQNNFLNNNIINTKIKLKDSNTNFIRQNRINKSQSNLNKVFKTNRSSTTHLNQYAKIILNQNEDVRKQSLLKRSGNSLSSLLQNNIMKNATTQNTKRQNHNRQNEGQQLNKDLQKVQDLLNKYKKKNIQEYKTNTFKLNDFNQFNLQQQSRLIKRNIQTAKSTQTRKSLHKISSSSGNMGKLHLGKNFTPILIPTKQQRQNPFYQKPQIITQNLINSKGIYNLISSGLLPKQYDFIEILNNKYQLIQQPKPALTNEVIKNQIMKIQQDNQAFMTNPILMSQYEQHKKKSQAQLINAQTQNRSQEQTRKSSRNKTRKTNLKKVKKIKNNALDKFLEIFSHQSIYLVVLQGRIIKNQQYQQYFKHCLRQGTQNDFLKLIEKMQQFTLKYNFKKIRFRPDIFHIKQITQNHLLSMIQNHKILGYDKTLRTKQRIVEAVIYRCIDMHRYKKIKRNLLKIQKIKKYFRIKRLYHQNIDKRYNFFKYRLGSFAEEQRKFVEDFIQQGLYKNDFVPRIQIHILTKSCPYNQQLSYYKIKQRLRSHMMRLFNSEASQIVFLVDPDVLGDIKQQMQLFLKSVTKMGQRLNKLTNKLPPNVHIFSTIMHGQNISHTGRTYFGIGQEIISFVRNLCQDQKPIIIPYQSSQYLPLICETFNGNLFGGSFTKETEEQINDQEEEFVKMGKQNQSSSTNNNNLSTKDNNKNDKFTKLKKKHTFQVKISKLKTFQLANYHYQDKGNIYQIFKLNPQRQLPLRITIKNKSQRQFYQQLVQAIITHKQSTKWVLKLSRSKFSRGIAILQTNDLKIFNQKRKIINLLQSDIKQISQIMNQVLKDKIILSHPNLMERQQFLSQFFNNQNSYIEEFIQNSNKICVFGKILMNGRFVFMGTYKKFYTNGVGFGASYPAQEFKQQMLQDIQTLSKSLSEQNFFGYVTYQFLYQQRTNVLYYLDVTPNLDEYSSLHYYYSSFFKVENMLQDQYKFNHLPKNVFYCPFLDNNANKFQDIQAFVDQCRARKIWYNSQNQEGQKFFFLKNDPSMLSLISFSNSQFQSIKNSIQAIAFLVDVGGKFKQFDKKHIGNHHLKTDGLYIMDILWKLRQIKKKMQSNPLQQINKNI